MTSERDEALPSSPSSVFTEQNILNNLFIIQKNIKGGNASNCMVVLSGVARGGHWGPLTLGGTFRGVELC